MKEIIIFITMFVNLQVKLISLSIDIHVKKVYFLNNDFNIYKILFVIGCLVFNPGSKFRLIDFI